MKKAGASFHDKATVKKYFAEGMNPDNIAQITSLRIEHVQAIITQIRSGKLKLKGKMAYQPGDGEHPMSGLTGAQSETRMDELSAENAALKQRLDAMDARLNVPAEPASVVIPPVPETVVTGDETDPALEAELAEEAETEQAEAPPEIKRKAPKRRTRAKAA